MKVKFVPQNIEHDIKPGESVMHVAQDHGLYIKSVCKGVPSCAECRVQVVEGEHNVLPPNSEELSLIGTGHFIDHRRLSCQLKCFGDITVDLTEQVDKQQLGGKKSKGLAAKSDRVEDETAIRSSGGDDSEAGGEESAGEATSAPPSAPASAQRSKPREGKRPEQRQEGRSAQGPRGEGGGRVSEKPARETKATAQAAPGEGGGDRKRRRRRRGGGGKGPGGGGQGGGSQGGSPQ